MSGPPDTPPPVTPDAPQLRPRIRRAGKLAVAFAVLAAVMVPWSVFLALTLPTRYRAANYDVAWAGFDIGQAVLLAATGWGLWRRAVWAQAAAVAAGTLLLVDAWFDVVTSHAGGDRMLALATAAIAEVPLALVCLVLAARLAGAELTIRRIAAQQVADDAPGRDK